jgi:alkylhydroperoxidase/carboxymuconolactone decarboxylase family protein YurZ
MDSHGAFATALLERDVVTGAAAIVDGVKCGSSGGVSPKMRELLSIARVVRARPRELTRAEVMAALGAGASDADVQLAVLIASAFSMFNRMVDGFRAATPPTAAVYAERAQQIADGGYGGASAVPGVKPAH